MTDPRKQYRSLAEYYRATGRANEFVGDMVRPRDATGAKTERKSADPTRVEQVRDAKDVAWERYTQLSELEDQLAANEIPASWDDDSDDDGEADLAGVFHDGDETEAQPTEHAAELSPLAAQAYASMSPEQQQAFRQRCL